MICTLPAWIPRAFNNCNPRFYGRHRGHVTHKPRGQRQAFTQNILLKSALVTDFWGAARFELPALTFSLLPSLLPARGARYAHSAALQISLSLPGGDPTGRPTKAVLLQCKITQGRNDVTSMQKSESHSLQTSWAIQSVQSLKTRKILH